MGLEKTWEGIGSPVHQEMGETWRGHVMVWGVVTPFGVGRLVQIEGNMDAAKYERILEEGLLGTASDFGVDLDAFVFQQDNDPKHKSQQI